MTDTKAFKSFPQNNYLTLCDVISNLPANT